MTFLHWPMLFTLAAVAVPILIHLLNRRTARVVDWGAMHFLMGSLVSRKRRVLLEEALLLAARCLLLSLVVLAIARPVVAAGSSPAWVVVLPLVPFAAVAFAAGTVAWQHRRWRWILLGSGTGFLLLGLLVIILGQVLNLGSLMERSRDVAVVIDGSASMSLEVDGKSNFARAVEEARDLVRGLDRSSTVSVILAGPMPQARTPHPLSDPARVTEVLGDLKLIGGELNVHYALLAASMSLSVGPNAGKQIVLLTDGQKVGWEADNRGLWETTAREVAAPHGVAPQLLCRALDMPDRVRNLAVTEVAAGRKVVGADRPLPVKARVTNTGGVPVSPSAALLLVDGKQADRRAVPALQPGASETLAFAHRFDTPGSHLVEVRVEIEDDLPTDNRRAHAVFIQERFPVLIVNGRPAPRLFDRASAFMQLALNPESLAAALGGVGPAGKPGFVDVTVVDVGRLQEVGDWGRFRVVILADVPSLPPDVAGRVADFVTDGGGLLVVPGPSAQPGFYNAWTESGQDPQRVLPARLGAPVVTPVTQAPMEPAGDTLTHPALAAILEVKKNDLGKMRLTRYWQLEADANDPQAVVGGRLNNAAPWLIEHSLGRGRVLLAASAFDMQGGNLPGLRSFPPLIHEIVYHLGDAAAWDLNPRPAREITLRLPAGPEPPLYDITAPDGSQQQASGAVDQGVVSLPLDRIALPGVYEVRPAGTGKPATARTFRFVVQSNPAESTLDRLSDADFEALRSAAGLRRLPRREDLLASVTGHGGGIELWKSLALLALLTLLGELGMTRWIALQRKTGAAETIDFSVQIGSPEFQEELAKMKQGQSAAPPAEVAAGEGQR